MATLFVAFGTNPVVRSSTALTFFEWKAPAAKADADVLSSLLAVYGVRDIFMGFALYSAAIWGTSKSLGWTMIAAIRVAFADGYVCFLHGQWEWNHWGLRADGGRC